MFIFNIRRVRRKFPLFKAQGPQWEVKMQKNGTKCYSGGSGVSDAEINC